jgi:hypothetical protein
VLCALRVLIEVLVEAPVGRVVAPLRHRFRAGSVCRF